VCLELLLPALLLQLLPVTPLLMTELLLMLLLQDLEHTVAQTWLQAQPWHLLLPHLPAPRAPHARCDLVAAAVLSAAAALLVHCAAAASELAAQAVAVAAAEDLR
jgi:hypothetical protein